MNADCAWREVGEPGLAWIRQCLSDMNYELQRGLRELDLSCGRVVAWLPEGLDVSSVASFEHSLSPWRSDGAVEAVGQMLASVLQPPGSRLAIVQDIYQDVRRLMILEDECVELEDVVHYVMDGSSVSDLALALKWASWYLNVTCVTRARLPEAPSALRTRAEDRRRSFIASAAEQAELIAVDAFDNEGRVLWVHDDLRSYLTRAGCTGAEEWA